MIKRRLTPADIAALAWSHETTLSKKYRALRDDPDSIWLRKELVRDVTLHLAIATLESDPRSLPALAGTLAKFIELGQHVDPPTMGDWADELLRRPDFNPAEFARQVRERYLRNESTKTTD